MHNPFRAMAHAVPRDRGFHGFGMQGYLAVVYAVEGTSPLNFEWVESKMVGFSWNICSSIRATAKFQSPATLTNVGITRNVY
jgi:hypothetical protein